VAQGTSSFGPPEAPLSAATRTSMKLPNADRAVLESRKVVDYLLNAAHPDNGGKAAFFESLGFALSDPELLIEALRAVARGEVGSKVASGHGDKYVIDGTLTSSAGRVGLVRTVWIIDRGATTPRFVTAYPRD
jgi:hypothetical protein